MLVNQLEACSQHKAALIKCFHLLSEHSASFYMAQPPSTQHAHLFIGGHTGSRLFVVSHTSSLLQLLHESYAFMVCFVKTSWFWANSSHLCQWDPENISVQRQKETRGIKSKLWIKGLNHQSLGIWNCLFFVQPLLFMLSVVIGKKWVSGNAHQTKWSVKKVIVSCAGYLTNSRNRLTICSLFDKNTFYNLVLQLTIELFVFVAQCNLNSWQIRLHDCWRRTMMLEIILSWFCYILFLSLIAQL